MNRALADICDRARSLAVKLGHSEITPWHLARAMAASGNSPPDMSEAVVDAGLRALPVTFGNPQPNEDSRRLLDEASEAKSPKQALRHAVGEWLQQAATAIVNDTGGTRADSHKAPTGTAAGSTPPPATEPSTQPAEGSNTHAAQVPNAEPGTVPNAEPVTEPDAQSPAEPNARPSQVRSQPHNGDAFELPARFNRFAVVVDAAEVAIDRPRTVEQVRLALRSRYPTLPVVVGAEGSGRTAFAGLLVERHGCLDREGHPAPVVRVNGAVARSRPADLEPLLQFCRERAVVVFDDFEVLLALGAAQTTYSIEIASFLRSMIEDDGNHLVAVMNTDYVGTLKKLDREFADELEIIELQPLDDTSLERLADRLAADIGAFHGVEFTAEVVSTALADVQADQDMAVPGRLAKRLDRAAARAHIAARKQVDVVDFDVTATPSAMVAPDKLRELLAGRVLGQDEAVTTVATIVARTKAKLDARTERPDGVLLLAGPTGSGKTELARALAAALHGSEQALIRLDMSEFYGDHTIANLIGSPPGYIGSESPDNWLTTRVRRRPDAVLLLDEIEKAHPIVWNAFLQVFDAGRLTDAAQGDVDFSRVTIVATTNLGAHAFKARAAVGFVSNVDTEAVDLEVIDTVKRAMSPELFNRFDAVLVFKPLTPEVIAGIAATAVQRVRDRARARGWNLTVDDAATERLAELGYSPEYGARELQRTVERELLDPLLVRQPGDYRATLDGDGRVVIEEQPPHESAPG